MGLRGPKAENSTAGNGHLPQKFTGQLRDETGLDYFHFRYYSGAQGRFLSPDPGNAGAYVARPQSWNGYAYGLNNPLRYVDPFGLESMPPIRMPSTSIEIIGRTAA